MPADQRFRAADPADLNCVALDALTAVYDRRSGQTHLLASPLPELLGAMGSGEWRLADFAAHLAGQFDLASTDGDTVVALSERMNELIAIGLVEVR
jgi:PqqD family protein of HPr-rel-A system